MAKKQRKNIEPITLETARSQALDLEDGAARVEAAAWALEQIEYQGWPCSDGEVKAWIRSILLNDLTETARRLRKQTRDHHHLVNVLTKKEALTAVPKAA